MRTTAKDRELIALLGENARLSVVALAKKLSLSRSTVQTRLERLERDGVIAGYSVRLSEEYSSGLVRAHILITVESKTAAQVMSALAKMRDVTSLSSISGAFDMIAMIAAPSVGALDMLIDQIRAIEGVERTLSSIILSTHVAR